MKKIFLYFVCIRHLQTIGNALNPSLKNTPGPINHNLNTYQDTLVWFVAIVADLFHVFDEISKFDSDSVGRF